MLLRNPKNMITQQPNIGTHRDSHFQWVNLRQRPRPLPGKNASPQSHAWIAVGSRQPLGHLNNFWKESTCGGSEPRHFGVFPIFQRKWQPWGKTEEHNIWHDTVHLLSANFGVTNLTPILQWRLAFLGTTHSIWRSHDFWAISMSQCLYFRKRMADTNGQTWWARSNILRPVRMESKKWSSPTARTPLLNHKMGRFLKWGTEKKRCTSDVVDLFGWFGGPQIIRYHKKPASLNPNDEYVTNHKLWAINPTKFGSHGFCNSLCTSECSLKKHGMHSAPARSSSSKVYHRIYGISVWLPRVSTGVLSQKK